MRAFLSNGSACANTMTASGLELKFGGVIMARAEPSTSFQLMTAPFNGALAGWQILNDMFRNALNNWSFIRIDYAGDREVETAVTSNVASFGKQLGILEEAVRELAHGKGGENVKRLEEMMKVIEWVKQEQAPTHARKPKRPRSEFDSHETD